MIQIKRSFSNDRIFLLFLTNNKIFLIEGPVGFTSKHFECFKCQRDGFLIFSLVSLTILKYLFFISLQ